MSLVNWRCPSLARRNVGSLPGTHHRALDSRSAGHELEDLLALGQAGHDFHDVAIVQSKLDFTLLGSDT